MAFTPKARSAQQARVRRLANKDPETLTQEERLEVLLADAYRQIDLHVRAWRKVARVLPGPIAPIPQLCAPLVVDEVLALRRRLRKAGIRN